MTNNERLLLAYKLDTNEDIKSDRQSDIHRRGGV